MKFEFMPEANLDGHIVFPHFLIAFGEAIKAGHADPFMVFKPTDQVLCLVDGEKIVGFMVYNFNEEFKFTWINFSYINPDYRGRGLGVFALMNTRIESITKNLGGNMVQSYVHQDNVASIKACEKIGRHPLYLLTRKRL